MEAVTVLGSEPIVLVISVCVVCWLFAGRRRDHALWIALAVAGGELLLWILKADMHRARPEPFFGTRLPNSYSFPSGHALLSLCCYGAIAAVARRRLLWIAAVVLIVLIGISRIYLGVHYPTDVIGGYLIAIAWVAGVAGFSMRSLRWRHEPARGRHPE
jgi:membrane-associated phospholipid phosphatase